MLIISIDVDVGNKKLGLINGGRNDLKVHKAFSEYGVGEIEELDLPLFVALFDHFHFSITFAVRGKLLEIDESAMELIFGTSIEHDIVSHGYYHRSFNNLS